MTTSDTPVDRQQLRTEIEQTRADLGSTVQALAEKTDVKTRAKRAVAEASGQARLKLSAAANSPKAVAVKEKAVTAKDKAVAARQNPAVRKYAAPAAAAAVVLGVAAAVAARRTRR